MANILPIPKALLIHQIEYEAFAGNDGWNDTFKPPITISNVRVEAVTRLRRGSNDEGEQVNHIVFVDRKHSSHFPEFQVKSRVTFNGVSREIVDVKPFFAYGPEPHHYELELR